MRRCGWVWVENEKELKRRDTEDAEKRAGAEKEKSFRRANGEGKERKEEP